MRFTLNSLFHKQISMTIPAGTDVLADPKNSVIRKRESAAICCIKRTCLVPLAWLLSVLSPMFEIATTFLHTWHLALWMDTLSSQSRVGMAEPRGVEITNFGHFASPFCSRKVSPRRDVHAVTQYWSQYATDREIMAASSINSQLIVGAYISNAFHWLIFYYTLQPHTESMIITLIQVNQSFGGKMTEVGLFSYKEKKKKDRNM